MKLELSVGFFLGVAMMAFVGYAANVDHHEMIFTGAEGEAEELMDPVQSVYDVEYVAPEPDTCYEVIGDVYADEPEQDEQDMCYDLDTYVGTVKFERSPPQFRDWY